MQSTPTLPPPAPSARRGYPGAWPFGPLTEPQRHQRALFEAQLRAGTLRRPPTGFAVDMGSAA